MCYFCFILHASWTWNCVLFSYLTLRSVLYLNMLLMLRGKWTGKRLKSACARSRCQNTTLNFINNTLQVHFIGNSSLYTVGGDYINTMKTTFDIYFILYQAVKQHWYTHKYVSQDKLSIKKASLWLKACKSKKAC